jgi:hypothetical protein
MPYAFRFPLQYAHMLATIAIVVVALHGCASMGYDDVDIDTTRKAIVVSTAEIAGATFLLQDLITRNAISQSDAQGVKDSLQDAKDGLQVALSAVDVAGDPATADQQLETAQRSVRLALAILGPLVEAGQ